MVRKISFFDIIENYESRYYYFTILCDSGGCVIYNDYLLTILLWEKTIVLSMSGSKELCHEVA